MPDGWLEQQADNQVLVKIVCVIAIVSVVTSFLKFLWLQYGHVEAEYRSGGLG